MGGAAELSTWKDHLSSYLVLKIMKVISSLQCSSDQLGTC